MPEKHSRIPALMVFLVLVCTATPLFAFEFKSIFSPHAKTVHIKKGFFKYDLLTFPKSSIKHPLILVLHGSGEDYADVFEKWRPGASKNEMILVVPDWISSFKASGRSVDDLTEFENLITEIKRHFPVDEEKMFIVGVSAGGRPAQQWIEKTPAYWLGCLFAAYVPSAEWMEKRKPETTPDLLFAYGKNDPSAQYERLVMNAAAMKRKGVELHLILDSEAGHEVREEWLPQIFQWLKNCSKRTNQ